LEWSKHLVPAHLCIPLISLYMNSARLKNIEETEKAKRVVAEERYDRRKPTNDEEHLVASRCEFCGRNSRVDWAHD
jgi:hypothetical protein